MIIQSSGSGQGAGPFLVSGLLDVCPVKSYWQRICCTFSLKSSTNKDPKILCHAVKENIEQHLHSSHSSLSRLQYPSTQIVISTILQTSCISRKCPKKAMSSSIIHQNESGRASPVSGTGFEMTISTVRNRVSGRSISSVRDRVSVEL